MTAASAPSDLETLNRLLVERIAAHYPGATIEDDTAVFGDSGIQIRGQVHQVQDLGAQQAASLFMWISGGPFGSTPSFASVSGYHSDAATAVVEGACHWTCTLLDVLAVAGLVHLEGRPADPTGSRTSEVSIHGRPFTLVSSGFNRLFGSSSADPRDNFEAFRRQLGGDGSMSSVVAGSQTLPVLAAPHVQLLSCFVLRSQADLTPEVKVHGADWGPSTALFNGLGRERDGDVLLSRELAVLVPRGPGVLERDALQASIAEVAARGGTTTDWGGWRTHGGRFAPPLRLEQIASVIDPARLPGDYVRYLTEVSGGGVGPGYGLVPPEFTDGELVLAHAGCGVRWVLRPDGVWVDSSQPGTPLQRTDASFTDWFGRWLDAAYVGVEFFDHEPLGDAPVDALFQVLNSKPQLAPNSVKMTVSTPPGRPDRPCHRCISLFAHFGQDEEHVFGGP